MNSVMDMFGEQECVNLMVEWDRRSVLADKNDLEVDKYDMMYVAGKLVEHDDHVSSKIINRE